jgi:hypothetical protein
MTASGAKRTLRRPGTNNRFGEKETFRLAELLLDCEFLKEYAIIVIGVLTALAAEQAVEWLHWQSG